MGKTLSEWLQEGEEVYQGAVDEYRKIEEQLRELATRWRAKKAEIDQIASIIGKNPLPDEQEHADDHMPNPDERSAADPRSAGRMNLGGPAVRR